MTPPQDKVAEFHRRVGQAVNTLPDLPGEDERCFRVAILREEFEDEYLVAEDEGDIVGIADALADMVYVIYGTAHTYGIDLDNVIDEVHASNMTKVGRDGKVRRREDGKILKPESYLPPQILGELLAQAYEHLQKAHQRRDDAAADYLRAPIPDAYVDALDAYDDAQADLEHAEATFERLEERLHG